MALITCPECRQSVSDQAVSCPQCGYPLAAQRVSVTPSEVRSASVNASGNPFLPFAAAAVGFYLIALPLTMIVVGFLLGVVAGRGGAYLHQLSSSLRDLFSVRYWEMALISALPLVLLLTTPVRLFAGRVHPLNVLLTITVNSALFYFLFYMDIGVLMLLFNMGPQHPIGFWIALGLWVLTAAGSGFNYYTERDSSDPNDLVGLVLMLGNTLLWFMSIGTIGISLFTEIIFSRHHVGGFIASSLPTTALLFAIIPWLTSLAIAGFLWFVAKNRWNLVDGRLRAEHSEHQALFQKQFALSKWLDKTGRDD